MATIDIEAGGRRYSVACRDGEEDHLRAVAALVDRKAQDAASALGSLSEARQLLFAALMLGDEVTERRAGTSPAAEPAENEAAADALERLAERVERLADRLESEGRAP